MRKSKVVEVYEQLQAHICTELEKADTKGSFRVDPWESEIGSGKTNVLVGGDAIEKAAVNFSTVKGSLSEAMIKELQLKEEGDYFATGISSIIHPQNPHVPIIHMNVRYFQLSSGKAWFGGGIDLTPHYINKKEAKELRKKAKDSLASRKQ